MTNRRTATVAATALGVLLSSSALCGAHAQGCSAAMGCTMPVAGVPSTGGAFSGVVNLGAGFQSSVTHAELADQGSPALIVDNFAGSGAAGTHHSQMAFRVSGYATGSSHNNYYMGLFNLSDSTPQTILRESGNVALMAQATRQNGTTNWQNGAVPSQIWGEDLVFNDLIPWGQSGYPAAPPSGASFLDEIDFAAIGPDTNGTRSGVNINCRVATGTGIANPSAECSNLISGSSSTLLTDGVTPQVTVRNGLSWGYFFENAILDLTQGTMLPGGEKVVMNSGDRIAFDATGQNALVFDPMTKHLALTYMGNLSNPVITAPGAGYTYCTAQIVAAAGDLGGGTNSTCTVNSSGGVASITFSNITNNRHGSGNKFVAAPTVVISGDGSGATATVAVSPEVQIPIGDGLSINTAPAFTATGTGNLPAYALGRLINLSSSVPSIGTLPAYAAATMRTGVITVFDNNGTAPFTIAGANAGAFENCPTGYVLSPGESVSILLDQGGLFRAVSATRNIATTSVKTGAYTITQADCSTTLVYNGTTAVKWTVGGAVTTGCHVVVIQRGTDGTATDGLITFAPDSTTTDTLEEMGTSPTYKTTGQFAKVFLDVDSATTTLVSGNVQ